MTERAWILRPNDLDSNSSLSRNISELFDLTELQFRPRLR